MRLQLEAGCCLQPCTVPGVQVRIGAPGHTQAVGLAP